ncbi:MAG: aminopeptidase, partial [Christensenellaceae bacterium]|nr:aminopeptidase [Christensenellaceae bacterium]
GTKIDISIGEDDADPVFVISDLLIHLAQKQMKKTGTEIVEGEKLDLLVGSRPLESSRPAKLKDKDSVAIKKNILDILKNKYDVEEEDFLSAELEIVPAGKARDMGLDRSMIISYGQDDRICAFTSLMAILDIETPERTACCLLVDKEEIGSVGASGMHSRFFENTLAEIVSLMGLDANLALRRALQNSTMLSSDVSAGYDPLYSDVFDKNNAAFLGEGPVFNKFTGSRGKSGSNDANPEFMARIRRVLDDEGILFQTSELGKVDVGGGGTIAYIMGNYGMEVIDCGIAILCMHAPFEVASKADIYETVRAYTAFLNKMDNIK